MVLLKSFITERCHNRHGTLESLNEFFKLPLDGVVLEVLFKSEADLGKVVGLLRDFLCLDAAELSLDPYLLKLFPFLEGAPHDTAK